VEAVERRMSSKRKIAEWFGVHESFLYKLLRQKRTVETWLRCRMVRGGGETCCRAVTLLSAPGGGDARRDARGTARAAEEESTSGSQSEYDLSEVARVRVDAKKKTKRASQADPTSGPHFKSTNQRWEGKS